MFGVDTFEMLILALVALLVIGPKDLPKAMRFVGHWLGKARGMARHFRAGLDTMMRESELEDMEKKWRDHNEAIMRAYPQIDLNVTPGSPSPLIDAQPQPKPSTDPVPAAPPPAKPADTAAS